MLSSTHTHSSIVSYILTVKSHPCAGVVLVERLRQRHKDRHFWDENLKYDDDD